MKSKFKIRVVSPWFRTLETTSAILSSQIPMEQADALLCDWEPSPELFCFPRRKAWYCCEPECQFNSLGQGAWPGIRRRLDPHEFLCHNHPDGRYRVPHITHFEDLSMNRNPVRHEKAIAIVSNHGGHPIRAHKHIRYRNRFVTHSAVELFGRSGWSRYRRHWYSRPGSPPNYRGQLPGDWPAKGKRELMAQYKVAVCLENMNEPYYFTEKFVEAVSAGCIPIYHADPTVANGVLEGAMWIDPASYGNDPESTLHAALQADSTTFREANQEWFQSSGLAATRHSAVFCRLGELLMGH